jgi:hypothetical protein
MPPLLDEVRVAQAFDRVDEVGALVVRQAHGMGHLVRDHVAQRLAQVLLRQLGGAKRGLAVATCETSHQRSRSSRPWYMFMWPRMTSPERGSTTSPPALAERTGVAT